MDVLEQACWLLLACRSGLPKRIVNTIMIVWCQERGRKLQEFFTTDAHEWSSVCQLNEKMLGRLEEAKEKLCEMLAFVKELSADSIHFLPIINDNYPESLKSTLKPSQIPPVLFYIGDLRILERVTIAIIGSRNAGEIGLQFTREVARHFAMQGANVISGYARGIDRAAYEGATSTSGYTTVVLPQGINTLSDAQMYSLLPRIEAGNVLLLSQFCPDAPWLVGRAMARNRVVTGLAQIVIVAEANMQGGTWDGAMGALEQKRPLYVYDTEASPLLPGNKALIEKGGLPLYWSSMDIVQNNEATGLLSSSLQGHKLLCQEQEHYFVPALSHQVALILREYGVYS